MDTLPMFGAPSTTPGWRAWSWRWWASRRSWPPGPPLALLFIDGGHGVEPAPRLRAVDPLVPGGTLVIHDVFPTPPTVAARPTSRSTCPLWPAACSATCWRSARWDPRPHMSKQTRIIRTCLQSRAAWSIVSWNGGRWHASSSGASGSRWLRAPRVGKSFLLEALCSRAGGRYQAITGSTAAQLDDFGRVRSALAQWAAAVDRLGRRPRPAEPHRTAVVVIDEPSVPHRDLARADRRAQRPIDAAEGRHPCWPAARSPP